MTKGFKIKIGKLLKSYNIPKCDNNIGSLGYYWETSGSDPNDQWLQIVEHHTSLAKPIFPEVVKVLQENGYNIEINQNGIYFH